MTAIEGYDDIHDNVRFWINRLTRGVAASAQHTAPTGATRAVVLFDIGANDGEVTLPILRETSDDRLGAVQIVAFEPIPEARARLINRVVTMGFTVALWGRADVTVIPLALGDADRMMSIDVYDDDTFSSLFSRSREELERYHLTATEQVEVRMRPLDDLIRSGTVAPPDVVKMDIEGAELAVLHGGAETFTNRHPPLLMEYSCVNTANAGYDRYRLIETLASFGYTSIFGLYRNEDRRLYGPDSLKDCRIWNIIALHERSGLPADVCGNYLGDWTLPA